VGKIKIVALRVTIMILWAGWKGIGRAVKKGTTKLTLTQGDKSEKERIGETRGLIEARTQAQKKAKRFKREVTPDDIVQELEVVTAFEPRINKMRQEVARFARMKAEDSFLGRADDLNKELNHTGKTKTKFRMVAKDILTTDTEKLGFSIRNKTVELKHAKMMFNDAKKRGLISEALLPKWDKFFAQFDKKK
jgi:hypothetical protein